MEKEHQPDSMATVNMKPEYPPSEVYSTSEPPPAYRHPKSASVQIAKIAAATIILSSLLLGSFILAASYVQARAGCHQLDQLDAMLEKELALEARQMQADAYMQDEPLPLHSAQALHQHLSAEDQKLNDEPMMKKQESKVNEEKLQSVDEQSSQSESGESDTSDSDSSSSESASDSSDSDENDIAREPIRITLPLQLDFDELAGALMEKNQRSRMNCIVEKRRAEELVDHQARNVRLPFGLNLTTDPRLERVTGERMAIFCESGNEHRQMPEGAEILPGMPIPLPGPVRLPLNFPVHPAMRFAMRPPMPAQHMQAPAPQEVPQYEMPQFQVPQQYQQPQQSQQPPRPFPPQLARFTFIHRPDFASQQQQQEQQQPQQPIHPQMTLIPREVRIHVQRVQMPQVEQEQVPEDSHMSQEDRQQEMMQMQEMPVPMQMITPEELRAVQQAVRAAEEHAEHQRAQRAQQEAQEAHEASHEMLGRQAMARSLPIHIPVPMMQQEEAPVQQDPERPHFVQPRSVRSVRSLDELTHRQKRVKRSCSCDCAC